MFCSNCGKELPKEAAFCPYCGSKILKVEDEKKDTVKEITDTVANHIEEAVEDISKAANNVEKEVSENIDNITNNASERLNNANEKIKNFNFSTLLEKKNVDLLSIAGSFGPIVTMIINLVLLTIIGILIGIFYKIYLWTIGDILVTISNIIYYILVYGIIVIAALGLGLLIYRFVNFNEKDNINIFQMIACVISIVATIGIIKNSGIKWIGIISLLLGVDFFITTILKKEEVKGNLDIMADVNYLKEYVNNNKKEKEESKPLNNINENNNINNQPVFNENDSRFEGTGGQLFVKQLLLVLVTIITCGIATPFILVKIKVWEKENTVINGNRLFFNGTGGQLWGLWIKWWFLSIITCGIYTYFAYVDYLKWETKHTTFANGQEINGAFEGSVFEGNSFEYLGYALLTSLVACVTCGIALPWMICIINKWQFKNTKINNNRLAFDLTGGKLFGTYLITIILTIITLGIYSPWGECRINRAIFSHVHIDNN